MKGVYLCFILIFFAITNIDAKIHQGPRQVDTLLENLEHEDWTDDEVLCKDATFSLLNAVKNHTTWATYIWDSMQHPVGVLYGARHHLGSFEQCLEDPWSMQPTQYCLVDVKLAESTRDFEAVDPNSHVQKFIGIKSNYGSRRLNFYSIGVCLPAVCSSPSVMKISRHIHQLSHLPFGDVSMDPRNCQVKESLSKYSVGFYAFWVVILTTTIIVIAVYVTEDSITDPKLIKLASWFSPTKNFEALVKTNKDEVKVLNGIRAICAGTSVVMHYYLIVSLLTLNSVDIGKSMKTIPGMFVVQLALLVDAFFVMSGLLHMKGLLTRRSGLVEMILKRHVRLLASLALSILFISAVLPYSVSGPLLPKLVVEQADTCVKNWKITSLMINNFVGTDEICPYVSWYLSCDFQLTIIGSVIFWCCQKWRRPAVLVFCALLYLASLIIPAFWTYWKEIPVILGYDNDAVTINGQNKVFQSTYIKPYSRASPYLIGLALGYFMHLYKPKDYRKTISKTWSILGGILGFVVIISIMGLGGALNLWKYNALHASLYAAFDRSVFAIGTCIIIIVTEYGTFPIIGDFLSSKVFVPLSRLSYGLCIYHPALIWQTLYSIRAPITYDFFHLFVNGFGYVVVSFMISYLLWFIVEAPVINMSSFQSRQITTSEKRVQENGVNQKSIKLM